MKVWITGAAGQVGRALQACVPDGAKVFSSTSRQCDITDPAAVARFATQYAPDLIINCAAYTAVDAAEADEAAAMAVNASAVAHLREAAQGAGARLVQISTDFVFDGQSGTPYSTDAARRPINVYGASKAAGEDAAGANALIIRTAWVYDTQGRNFLTTMLRLMAERDELRVVADQVGTPTSTETLARAIWALAGLGESGSFHVTDSGVASWYDFAVAIGEEALSLGLLHRAPPIIPISSFDYPTAARRPAFSVLDKSKTIARISAAPHWRLTLRMVLADLAANQAARG